MQLLLLPFQISLRSATLGALQNVFDHEDYARSNHLLRRGFPLLCEQEPAGLRYTQGAKRGTNLSFDTAFPTAQLRSGSLESSMDT